MREFDSQCGLYSSEFMKQLLIINFYRFTKPQIRLLLQYFELDSIQWRSRYNPSSEMALCILLVKLSYPHRLFELFYLFGRSPAFLSSVFTDIIEYLCDRYDEILRWHPTITYRRIRRYARAIKRLGGAGLIWGFIDGTFKGLCRPEKNQKNYYSGYKKQHGLKWQAIVCSDGLIGSLEGSFLDPVNDQSSHGHRFRIGATTERDL